MVLGGHLPNLGECAVLIVRLEEWFLSPSLHPHTHELRRVSTLV